MTLIDNQTRFIVQGVTGNAAQWHLKEMLDLGQPVLAGVQPGGPREPVHGVPVFQSVAAACGAIAEPPDATLIFVPAAYAVDAAHEAIASRIPLLIWIAEGVPVHDTMRLVDYARGHGVRVVGPNTPGIISPGRAKGGLMPSSAFSPGPVGMVSRSGTLSYETALELTVRGIGQSTFIGVGGDCRAYLPHAAPGLRRRLDRGRNNLNFLPPSNRERRVRHGQRRGQRDYTRGRERPDRVRRLDRNRRRHKDDPGNRQRARSRGRAERALLSDW